MSDLKQNIQRARRKRASKVGRDELWKNVFVRDIEKYEADTGNKFRTMFQLNTKTRKPVAKVMRLDVNRK
jgi:hypothetical protein